MATKNGTSGDDTLNGTAAADRLNGLGGDDVLNGGAGRDTLNGGEGTDTLRGGGGNDLYLVAGSPEVFTNPVADVIQDTGGIDTVIVTQAGYYTLGAGLEVLIVRGSESVNVGPGVTLHYQGNALDNTLRNERTSTQAVVLDGGGGDDVLLGNNAGREQFRFSGSFGNDYVDAGGGENHLAFAANAPVVFNFADGFASSDAGTVTVVGTITKVWGSAFHGDRLTGDGANNQMYGGGGNDTLSGGGGDDILEGGYDDDRLLGGAAQDEIWGGIADDYIDGGGGWDWVYGEDGHDRIVWDTRDLTIDGGEGFDTLIVRSGNLNLTAYGDDKVVEIEAIDLSAAGTNRLAISEEDVLALAGGSTVYVYGNGADSINIVGEFTDEGVGEDGWHYYRLGERLLAVDIDITNVS